MSITSEASVVPSLGDIIITPELFTRPDRASKLEDEVAAFQELAAVMAFDAHAAVRRFLQLSMTLCEAGSAGVSMLRRDDSGSLNFVWEALEGELQTLEGVVMPRDFSACGLCIDTAGPILVSRPARLFPSLRSIQPELIEALFVPLYDNARHVLGTLWVAHHSREQHFVPNDLRVLEQLASQLVLALKLSEERRHHMRALNAVNERLYVSELERRRTQTELAAERERRERAETSESGLWEALSAKDALIQEVHHRVKNSIQVTASLLSLQARSTRSGEASEVLREAQSRLQTLAKVHELLYRGSLNAQEVPMPALLTSLAAALQQSFSDTEDRIQVEYDLSDIVMHPDQAIPLALFTNEVLTNAYKHAFPSNERGSIRIELRPEHENYVLQITDNGVGVPSDMNSEGLGIKLMKTFSTQLRAQLQIEPAAGTGTRVCLQFPTQLQ